MDLGGCPCSPDTVLPGSPPAGAQLCVLSQPSLWAKAILSLVSVISSITSFSSDVPQCPSAPLRGRHTHTKKPERIIRDLLPTSRKSSPAPSLAPAWAFLLFPHVLTPLGADPDLLTSKDVVCMAVSSLQHHQCSFLFWILPIST